jgi:hypothetical protein
LPRGSPSIFSFFTDVGSTSVKNPLRDDCAHVLLWIVDWESFVYHVVRTHAQRVREAIFPECAELFPDVLRILRDVHRSDEPMGSGRNALSCMRGEGIEP